jgi:hypothetical protein
MIRLVMVRDGDRLQCRSAAVLLILSVVVVGCTSADEDEPSLSPVSSPSPSPSPSTSPVPSAEARDRLTALGDEWFRTVATITYHTTAPVPGQPATAHLCLRQLADRFFGAKDRTALLRRCSRQGSLRLVWDPPNRWRMDVITPVDRFTLTSAHDRTRLCRFRDPDDCRATQTADAIDEAGVDVFFRPPEQILDEIGATEVAEIDSPDDAVVPVECFAASGRNEHVEWCYAADGSLVSFLRGPSAKGWRSFEATDVA